MVTQTKVDVHAAGQRLREQRESMGLSQEQVAMSAGITEMMISRTELGSISKPSMELLSRLAKVYGFDLNQIGMIYGYWTLEDSEKLKARQVD